MDEEFEAWNMEGSRARIPTHVALFRICLLNHHPVSPPTLLGDVLLILRWSSNKKADLHSMPQLEPQGHC